MRKVLITLLLISLHLSVAAQYKTDRLIDVGRSALFYEDYVLSIQYFSQVITAKPYLYEPWFLRGVAKYYLDDYTGAEKDCSEAIEINPYISDLFELRGLCRIRQGRFKDAVADYDKTIKFNPYNKGMWYNRVLCRIEDKDYKNANADLDSMMTMWKTYAKPFSLKAEVCMLQKDTIAGARYLDRSLELDPYDGEAWTMRAMISLSQRKWRDADTQLSKAIHLKPTTASYYVNRALARYNINNLRGALADYDKAIELDPNNFLAHYNRGQMRVQVGDYNRAVADFDYVIRMEPDNVMAIYNRALLLEKTGDLKGAVRDYSYLIGQYPNFWIGLSNRARLYRRMGQTAKAEMDEFRIFKAQMDKHNGIQPRWNKKTQHEVRKKSEINFDKYNQLVVADEQTVEHEYSSAYRGRVQDRKTTVAYMPMFMLSFARYDNGIKTYQAFDADVEAFNIKERPAHRLYVNCGTKTLTAEGTKLIFAVIDSLSAAIDATRDLRRDKGLLIQRAVANSVAQNYADAVNDLTAYIQNDSTTSSLVYWQRAVCQARMNEYEASRGMDVRLKTAGALNDMDTAIKMSPRNAYLYYDRANLYAVAKDYMRAIADYTEALRLDPRLAEAYYNRGLVYIYSNKREAGIQDLSKAGELGLYNAYSAIKSFTKTKK